MSESLSKPVSLSGKRVGTAKEAWSSFFDSPEIQANIEAGLLEIEDAEREAATEARKIIID
jgi:hypothetical protein